MWGHMFGYLVRKEVQKWITILMICCCFSFAFSTRLHSQEFIVNNEEESCRLKAAYMIAGVAVIAVGAGIAYAASCSGHGKSCHDSYCSYSNYYNSCYSSSSSCSDHHHHSSGHSDYSSYFSGSSSSSIGAIENGLLSGNFPLGRQKRPRKHRAHGNAKEKDLAHLSGTFTVHSLSTMDEGHATVFVQTPSGAMQTVGSFSLADRVSGGIPFGPFKESGTYMFGLNMEGVGSISVSEKLCSVEVKVNDVTVESHDFMLSSMGGGEPGPFYYTMQ
jgi:hypothetical protein